MSVVKFKERKVRIVSDELITIAQELLKENNLSELVELQAQVIDPEYPFGISEWDVVGYGSCEDKFVEFHGDGKVLNKEALKNLLRERYC